MDAREKREAERRAAGEVDEDEEEETGGADSGGDGSGAVNKESTPEKPGKENQVCFRRVQDRWKVWDRWQSVRCPVLTKGF